MGHKGHETHKTYHEDDGEFVILEGSRVQIESTHPVNIYNMNEDGTIRELIQGNTTNFDRKMYGIEILKVETSQPHTGYNFTEYKQKELDKTPVEVPVEAPPTQLSLIRQALAQERLKEQQFKEKMTFEEFIDLNMADELPDIFPAGLTVAEAQSEAIRQHLNPLRGFNLEDYDKGKRPPQEPESKPVPPVEASPEQEDES